MLPVPPIPRAFAIAGPTASGKSAASLAVTQALDAEIVSVDSALVYRGMNIGTAKPTAAERALVAHHLIDIRDPRDAYSAAEFAADAKRIVAEINERGRIALLVGGTMLYFKALFEGLDDMPAADPAIRAAIESEASARGWPALHADLARLDAVTAQRLAPNDSQRIQRALEVHRATGQPLSSFHQRKSGEASSELKGDASPWALVPLFSLEPNNRAWLHERIAERFDDMLDQGFLKEVKALRARGDLNASLPSMRCVGYRQGWELLDEHERAEGNKPFPMAELRERGIFATRQLAKRQLTWLRGMHRRRVIACDEPLAAVRLLDAIKELL